TGSSRRSPGTASPAFSQSRSSRLRASDALLALRRFATMGREPWRVLVPLLVIQLLAEIVFAFSVNHNGFVFYQGGDQIWYYTTGWLGRGGRIPEAVSFHA